VVVEKRTRYTFHSPLVNDGEATTTRNASSSSKDDGGGENDTKKLYLVSSPNPQLQYLV
jgi:hypothetical protein